MRKFIMAGISAVVLATVPLAAIAQDTGVGASAEATVTTPGDVTLSAEQQVQFDTWTPEIKTYYGTLNAAQQEAFWMLSAEQRMQLSALTDGQKAEAWTSILAQVEAAKNGQPNPATPAESATPATPAPGEGVAAQPAIPPEPAAPIPQR